MPESGSHLLPGDHGDGGGGLSLRGGRALQNPVSRLYNYHVSPEKPKSGYKIIVGEKV